MAMKEELEDFYDIKLEPDVILIDSDESDSSLTVDSPGTPYAYTSKNEDMQLTYEKVEKMTTEAGKDSTILQQCPTCKKYFKRINSHVLTHRNFKDDPERPFSCIYCRKVFKNLSNLNVHIRSHTGFKPYVCEVCNKGFTQSGNLVHHMRIHTGSRPYKCTVCDRCFTQPGNLNNHMRLHRHEKPFRCHLCDRAFTQSSNLNSHLRNNHKQQMTDT